MTTEEKVVRHKLGLLELAKELRQRLQSLQSDRILKTTVLRDQTELPNPRHRRSHRQSSGMQRTASESRERGD